MQMRYTELFQQKMTEIICDIQGQETGYEIMIEKLVQEFRQIRKERQMVYFIGNGGSAGIAIHMTSDFLKNGGIRTHSMHDPATITCLGNDFGYAHIFSKQLEIIAAPGDMLVAISSSGNSPNILQAVKTAKEKSCRVITLSGFRPNNQLRRQGAYNIYVPIEEYGIVESLHNMILQQVVDGMMRKPEGSNSVKLY